MIEHVIKVYCLLRHSFTIIKIIPDDYVASLHSLGASGGVSNMQDIAGGQLVPSRGTLLQQLLPA